MHQQPNMIGDPFLKGVVVTRVFFFFKFVMLLKWQLFKIDLVKFGNKKIWIFLKKFTILLYFLLPDGTWWFLLLDFFFGNLTTKKLFKKLLKSPLGEISPPPPSPPKQNNSVN